MRRGHCRPTVRWAGGEQPVPPPSRGRPLLSRWPCHGAARDGRVWGDSPRPGLWASRTAVRRLGLGSGRLLLQTCFKPSSRLSPPAPEGAPGGGSGVVTSRDDGQASSPAWMLGWGSHGHRPPIHILAPTFFEPGRWFWGGGWETCACPLIPALPLCDLRHHPTLSGLFLPYCVELE